MREGPWQLNLYAPGGGKRDNEDASGARSALMGLPAIKSMLTSSFSILIFRYEDDAK